MVGFWLEGVKGVKGGGWYARRGERSHGITLVIPLGASTVPGKGPRSSLVESYTPGRPPPILERPTVPCLKGESYPIIQKGAKTGAKKGAI